MKHEILGNSKQAELNLYVCERDEKIRPGTRYGPIIRDSYIIDYCSEGSGRIIINGREFAFSAGSCLVLLPGDTVGHITDGSVPRSGIWCAAKGLRISSYLAAVGIDSGQPYAPEAAAPKIAAILGRMLEIKNERDAGAELRQTACIHALFGEMLRYAQAKTDQSAYIRQALRIIETRYDTPLSVAALARSIGLERSYFSTLFHKAAGVSPQRYITDFRMQKACGLLAAGLTVGATAEAVGISPESFARIFKSRIGQTPSQYVQSLKAAPLLSDEWICRE